MLDPVSAGNSRVWSLDNRNGQWDLGRRLDAGFYPLGVRLSDAVLAAIPACRGWGGSAGDLVGVGHEVEGDCLCVGGFEVGDVTVDGDQLKLGNPRRSGIQACRRGGG